jgi:hypothetical protein
MSEKVSLLEKLGQARIDFQSAGIKKTGKNSYVGFEYYELSDILPKINELSNQYRFICAVSFNSETALLKIIDIDDQNQFIEFASPMAGVNLKGAHDIQNMGAVQTYMRRYLYMMAFEIVEYDTFDGSMGKKEPQNTPHKSTPNSNETTAPINEQKIKIGKEIGEILETKNPDGQPYFKELEIEQERKYFTTGNLQAAEKQLEKLKKFLETRKANYKPIPEEQPEFQDDIPF